MTFWPKNENPVGPNALTAKVEHGVVTLILHIFLFLTFGHSTLALNPERQSARMSEIKHVA